MTRRKSSPSKRNRGGAAKGIFAEPRYVWVFQCSHRITLHAASLDRKGRNLPKDVCLGGAWTLTGQLVVESDHIGRSDIDIATLKIGIERNGFYLWSTEMEPPPDTSGLMR